MNIFLSFEREKNSWERALRWHFKILSEFKSKLLRHYWDPD